MWPRVERLAEVVLAPVLDAGGRESLLGDLAEERWRRRASGWSGVRAGLYWGYELMRSVAPLVRDRLAGRGGSRRRSAKSNGEGRVGQWLQDVRYAVRSLRGWPGLAATVVAMLALGMGASTTVFTVVDNVVLNPFPYPDADRLVGVGPVFPKLGRELSFWEALSPAEYVDIRDRSETLEAVVAWDMGNRAVTVGDRTENLFSAFWWGDAFPTLGVRPALGRGFTATEVEGRDPVAVLSHRVWATRFGADSSLLGGAILVNGEPYTLVGVMPRGTLVYGTDLWIPMPVGPDAYPRARRQFQVLGRLAPGASLESARAELALLADRTASAYGAEHPEYEGWSLVPMTWTDINVRQLRPAALALLGAIAFVLLLVCANVASMLLARSAARQREIAVRTALGARRGRILRQLLTESLILSLAAAALGTLVSVVGVGALVRALNTLALPVPGEIVIDGRVLAFTALVAVATGVAFGLVPALYAVRTDIRGMLQADARGATSGAGRLRLQRTFVGVEVALALVLLVSGGLLIHSFLRLNAVDPGFETRDVLTMRLTLAWERYEREEMEPFLRELTRRLEEHPAISGAATATQFPPLLFGQSRFAVEGAASGDEETLPTAYTTIVSPDYFDVLGIRPVSGRLLTDADRPGGVMAVVVNEALAARYFPGATPVGRRLRLGGPDSEEPWFEVVGVAASTRNQGLDVPPAPEMFASIAQLPSSSNQHYLLIRAPGAGAAVLPAVRETVAALDPEQPVYAIRTVDEAFAGRSAERRIVTTMLALFGVFALLLAAVGIYAVVSYAVSQRTREIGLRMALGADGGSVRGLLVRQALMPVLVGGAVGLVGAVVLGRLLSGLLFEVGSTDPWTYAAVVAVFGATALAASYIPARRASRLDPVLALREEAG